VFTRISYNGSVAASAIPVASICSSGLDSQVASLSTQCWSACERSSPKARILDRLMNKITRACYPASGHTRFAGSTDSMVTWHVTVLAPESHIHIEVPSTSGLGRHFSSPKRPRDKRKTQSLVSIPGQREQHEQYLAQLRDLLENKQPAQEAPSLNVQVPTASEHVNDMLSLQAPRMTPKKLPSPFIPVETSLSLPNYPQRNGESSPTHRPNVLIHAGRVFFQTSLRRISVITHTLLENGLRIFPRRCHFALMPNVHERVPGFFAYFLIVSPRITSTRICLSDIFEILHRSIS
jgi:hypothetical protein